MPEPRPVRSLRADAARALAADLGWHARIAGRRLSGAFDLALAPAGVSSIQFGLLCLVASAPDDTLGALAARAGLNQSTMSRNLDKLTRAGLVEIATVERDRRQHAVWLTEAGARRLQSALPLWRNAQRALEQALGPRLSAGFAQAASALDKSAAEE